MKKILLITAILSLSVAFIFYLRVRYLKAENVRLNQNNVVLLSENEYATTQNGQIMAKIDALELTNQEIKEHFSDVVKELENVNVKLRKLEGYTSTATETTYEFHTQFRDSVIRDTVKIEKLAYKDAWIDLEIIKQGLDAEVNLVSKDSIIQVVYWERPKGFWFIHWGRKQYSQKIHSLNPYTEIKFAQYITPVRKHR